MSCLGAKISLIPKHRLIVPSSYWLLQHTSDQTSYKAAKPQIHTLRPLTYELFFKKNSKIEGVVLNRACIEEIFCPKLGQNSNPQYREAPGKRRVPWNEKDDVTALSQEQKVRFCMLSRVLPVHRGQRVNSWTRQKNAGSHLFLLFRKFISPFRVLNTSKN